MTGRWMPALALALIAALSATLAVACDSDGGGEDEFPEVVRLGEGEIFPSILNTALTVGENRLVMSLTDTEDRLVEGAGVSLRFYELNGDGPAFRFETDARFIPVDLSYVDEQAPTPDPTTTGQGGAYVANVTFDATGEWGMRVETMLDGETHESPFRFNVLAESPEPMIGEEVPPSVQPTTATVGSVEEIDSSFPPRPQMHDITIADALDAGQPLVVAFATPAYCTQRLCAPVMDTVMDPLSEEYADRAIFIHVEPYVLSDLRAGFVRNPVPATREWGIQTEPWVFVIGADGRVVGKFEGIVAADEVEAALQAALAAAPA